MRGGFFAIGVAAPSSSRNGPLRILRAIVDAARADAACVGLAADWAEADGALPRGLGLDAVLAGPAALEDRGNSLSFLGGEAMRLPLSDPLSAWEALMEREATSVERAAAVAAARADAAGGETPPSSEGRGIALVGLMGAGKTTVGRELAARRGLPFVDLDEEVERAAGLRVSAIFEREGEGGFRVRESAALVAAADRGSAIIATGGGVVLDPRNRAILRERYTTVLLFASPELAARRAAGDTRPLLAGVDPERRLRELWQSRRKAYLLAADFAISAEGEAPAIAARIDDEID